MRIFLAAALLAPAAAVANGYHLPLQNPRDLAFGGSGTAAIQNSASAVVGNPAALAGLDGLNVVGNLELITLASTWQDTTGTVGANSAIDTTPKAAFPPSLYVSYSDKLFGHNAGVGLGFSTIGGGLFYWPYSWPGRSEIINVDRRTFGFDLAAAYQPIDMLKVAAGLIYYRSQEKLVQGLDFLNTLGDVQLGAAGGAFSFSLGGELQPIEGLKIGIAYRHQAVQSLTGDAHFGNVPPTFQLANPQLVDQTATHQLTFPNIVQSGISYQATPDLLLNAGYLFVRWVVYKQDVFVGDRGVTVTVPHDFHNGYGFTGGAEYRLPVLDKAITVRAAVERVIGPAPSDTMHPAIPDANSTSLCFGAGYAVNDRISIDVGDKLAFLDTVQTTGPEAFPGKYNTTANFLSVGVTWKFGKLFGEGSSSSAPPVAVEHKE
jgi:long-subunit fatty acid transport protein